MQILDDKEGRTEERARRAEEGRGRGDKMIPGMQWEVNQIRVLKGAWVAQ